MMSSTIIGCLLSVVALGTLVASSPGSVIQLNKFEITRVENEYYGVMDIDFKNENRKTTTLDIAWPVKKELPPTMNLMLHIEMKDLDPVEYTVSICDALDDEIIGRSLKDHAVPKDEYPQTCPFKAGDWKIINWTPPAEKVPPGIKEGPLKGYMTFSDGDDPFLLKVDFEGEIFFNLPQTL